MFSFTIEYRKGKAHGNADALSRLCIDCEENENDSEEEFITINVIICEETLNEDQSEDNDLVWIFDLKKQALSENKHHMIVKEFANSDRRSLYAQWNRIIIVNNTIYRIWKNNNSNTLNTEVENYIKYCETFQRIKINHFNNTAPLQPIITDKPFEIITADITGPLPVTTNQNKYILIICDHFTKWTEIFAIQTTTAQIVAKSFEQYFCRHGIPDQLLTDQGTNFQSEIITEICDLFDIHKTRTAPYTKQTQLFKFSNLLNFILFYR